MDNKKVGMIGLGLLIYGRFSNITRNQDNLVLETRGDNPTTFSYNNGEDVVMPGVLLTQFNEPKYEVTFKYPQTWIKNPRYEEKYEGKTGFFEISAFEGNADDIDAVLQQQIQEPDQLYGMNPKTEELTVDGQPARLIIPSNSQNKYIRDRELALLVKYKKPIQINGNTYDYLVIWATPEYMPIIIRSLKFLQ